MSGNIIENKRVTIRLDTDTYEQLSKYANSQKLSISDVIRDMIYKGLSVESYKEDEQEILYNMERVVQNQFENYMERIISLMAKNTIVASVSMIEAEFLLQRISKPGDKQRLKSLIHKIYLDAIKFVKTPSSHIEDFMISQSKELEEYWNK